MPCEKCNYKDKKEVKKFDKTLCTICNLFAPDDQEKFNQFINEKIDWKVLETFRKFGQSTSKNLKQGMQNKAKEGKLVTRPPKGYDFTDGKLIQNEEASKVHSLFKTFLEKDYSLNSLAKNYALSVNGIKKILQNRTYLGEIKFAGQLHKGTNNPIISQELFYAVQRKLKEVLRS